MVFVALPDVSPGVNPAPEYLAALHLFAFPAPSPGFKIRLELLFAVTALYVTLCSQQVTDAKRTRTSVQSSRRGG